MLSKQNDSDVSLEINYYHITTYLNCISIPQESDEEIAVHDGHSKSEDHPPKKKTKLNDSDSRDKSPVY